MQLDVSIIIPVYNVEPYIEKCLRSVMEQENCGDISIECLVVDDRGTDSSITVARSLIQSYEGPIYFRIITREQNGGLSAARNSGIREARGQYLYFLDSDDYISENCISTLWNHVVKHPGVELVFGQSVCTPNPESMKSYLDFRNFVSSGFCNNRSDLDYTYLKLPEIAWNKLILRKWLVDNGLYFKEGILHEDYHWHLMSYLSIGSYAVELNGQPSYYYLQREGSIMNNREMEGRRLENLKLIYSDFFSRQIRWTKYLNGWTISVLDRLKSYKEKKSNNPYRLVRKLILENQSVPARVKWIVRMYPALQSGVGRRVVNFALSR